MRQSKKRFYVKLVDGTTKKIKCGRILGTTSAGYVRQVLVGRHPKTVNICGRKYLIGAIERDGIIRTEFYLDDLLNWDTFQPFSFDDEYQS